MQLFVIRHAIAENKVADQEDAARELTRDGVRKFVQVVKGLRVLGISFERVLTSPWTRAASSATLLEAISESDPISTELLARAPTAELLAMIAERGEDTAVVGHEPWLGELVAWLAFGDTRHGEALQLKKGGVVWLEGSAVPGGMTVRALWAPKILRALRRAA